MQFLWSPPLDGEGAGGLYTRRRSTCRLLLRLYRQLSLLQTIPVVPQRAIPLRFVLLRAVVAEEAAASDLVPIVRGENAVGEVIVVHPADDANQRAVLHLLRRLPDGVRVEPIQHLHQIIGSLLPPLQRERFLDPFGGRRVAGDGL